MAALENAMKRCPWIFGIVLSATIVPGAHAASLFDRHFENATLRIDFHHTGNAVEEHVSIDHLYRQGRWAGSRSRLVDPFSYGGYLVEAREVGTDNLLFSKGFDSFFGEYRTTAAAISGTLRTYHESVLLPFPKKRVTVNLIARRRDGTFVELLEIEVDPGSIDISGEPPSANVLVIESHIGGPPSGVVDIAILGEGYTESGIAVFKADLAKATDVLLGQAPFASHRDRISVRGVLAISADSSCDEPTRGAYRDTALGVSFNSLGSERYLLTEDNRSLRDIAANVPYDALIIMVNHDRYGGGGIYNLFSTFTAHSRWSEYLLLHEFGHSFAGLADEYYSSSVAYNDFYPQGREPAEPNITALLDPENLKWKDFIEPGTKVPTPWEKEGYDLEGTAYQKERTALNEAIAEAARTGVPEERVVELREKEERHAAAHAEWAQQYLAGSRWAGKVGAFEGAGYSSTGLYRPMLDCLMFSRRVQPFCGVCERAVEAMILRYSE
jgi:hypothetical protein